MSQSNPEQRADEKQTWPGDGPRRLPWRTDYGVGITVFLFCAVILYLTTTFDEVPAARAQGVPPEQFPQLLLALIAGLAVLMMHQARGQEEKKRKPVPAMVYLSAGLLVLFIAVVQWVGIIVAMILFCIALPLLWGDRRYLPILVFAAVFPFFVYYLFSWVMEVHFPMGLFVNMLR